MKKNLLNLSALVFILIIAYGCGPAVKKSETPTKDTTVLQFMGFNSELVFEEDNIPFTETRSYFLYYFENEILKIDRVSKESYYDRNLNNPIEKNVGQFGLTTLAHADRVGDPITNASINYQAFRSCDGDQDIPVYGQVVTFSDPAGKNTIDLNRELKLFEFISDMYELSSQENNSCISFEAFRNADSGSNPRIMTLHMTVNFKVETKSGNQSSRSALFFLKGIVR